MSGGDAVTVKNKEAGIVLRRMIKAIQENKDYLSEVDGKIGDGDHGINMNKGFTMCEERLAGRTYSLFEGLMLLSSTLMEDIGGSMGPLYGVFFEEMAMKCENAEEITAELFGQMLKSGIEGIQSIGNAKLGDKSLLDTLIPAEAAYANSLAQGADFAACLNNMKDAAKSGWQSTENMVAKIGRASRLGERSRGVLDAGATSSYLLLTAIAEGLAAF